MLNVFKNDLVRYLNKCWNYCWRFSPTNVDHHYEQMFSIASDICYLIHQINIPYCIRQMFTFTMNKCPLFHRQMFTIAMNKCPPFHRQMFTFTLNKCPPFHQQMFTFSMNKCPPFHQQMSLVLSTNVHYHHEQTFPTTRNEHEVCLHDPLTNVIIG